MTDSRHGADDGGPGAFVARAAVTPRLDAAKEVFGAGICRSPSAYAELLVTDGVVRGLIGPREAPRIVGTAPAQLRGRVRDDPSRRFGG